MLIVDTNCMRLVIGDYYFARRVPHFSGTPFSDHPSPITAHRHVPKKHILYTYVRYLVHSSAVSHAKSHRSPPWISFRSLFLQAQGDRGRGGHAQRNQVELEKENLVRGDWRYFQVGYLHAWTGRSVLTLIPRCRRNQLKNLSRGCVLTLAYVSPYKGTLMSRTRGGGRSSALLFSEREGCQYNTEQGVSGKILSDLERD